MHGKIDGAVTSAPTCRITAIRTLDNHETAAGPDKRAGRALHNSPHHIVPRVTQGRKNPPTTLKLESVVTRTTNEDHRAQTLTACATGNHAPRNVPLNIIPTACASTTTANPTTIDQAGESQ